MIKIILVIIVVLLFRRLIYTLGSRRGYKPNTNEYNKNNNQSEKAYFHEESQTTEYKCTEDDKKILTIPIDHIQNELDTIISYIPNFQLHKFVKSAADSLYMIYEVMLEKADESYNEKEIIEKLKYLVESSYINTVISKQYLITKYIKEINQLKLKQIYLLSTKTFILLTTSKENIEFTFTKNLKHNDKNWYLSKIETKQS